MSEFTPEDSGRSDRRPSGPPRGKPARPGGARGGSGSRPSGRSGGPSEARGRSGDRPYGKGKPGERSGDRPYGKGKAGERSDDRPYTKGRPSEGSGNRPYGKGKPAEGSGERPYGKKQGDRPYGASDTRSGERPASRGRPAGRGGDRPYGDRPYGDRPAGQRTSSGRSSDRADGDRPYSKGRPTGRSGDRPDGDRPYGKGRPTGRGADRPDSDRPYGRGKPAERGERRPDGDRPYGKGKPAGRGDRPYGKTGERSSERPYSGKAGDRGGRRPSDSRPGERGSDRPYDKRRDAERPREAPRPGLAAKANEPETPKGLDLRELPRGVRAELRGLPTDRAEEVGAHLLMAGRLVDTDPQLAYAHAEAARRRAARLPITREAAAETAYAAGDYQVALSEFRALRRMRGGDEYLPAMADCERALRRHQAALKLIREGLAANPEVPQLVELRLVEAGVRVDTGQVDEALRLLKAEIERVGARGPKISRARLRYAYADLLERSGEGEAAERWFDAVVRLDPDQSTDAEDRLAALRGLVIEYVDEDEDEADGTEDAEADAVDEAPDAEPTE